MSALADWLVEENIVTPAQLAQARQLQKESAVPLAMALVELRLIEEGALVDLIARRLDLPKAPKRMHRITIPPRALTTIPQDYCWQHGLFPFGIEPSTRKLQVAIVDPADGEAIALLKKLARQDFLLYVAGPRQLEKAIRKHYLDSWIDDDDSSAPHRFFGYENITNPGLNAKHTPAPVAAEGTSGRSDLAAAAPVVGHALLDPSPGTPISAVPTVDAGGSRSEGNRPAAADPSPRDPPSASSDYVMLWEDPSAVPARRTTPPPVALHGPPTPPVSTHGTHGPIAAKPTPPPVALHGPPTPPPVATRGPVAAKPTPPPIATRGPIAPTPTPPIATRAPLAASPTPPPAGRPRSLTPPLADPIAASPTPPPAARRATGMQLAKVREDRVGDLQLRIEALERAVAELLAVLGAGWQDSGGRIAKISAALRRALERKD